MKKQRRQPRQKVRAISGEHKNDVITQEDLCHVSTLQAAEWLAADAAHKANCHLSNRLRLGAQIEAGNLTYDRELRMVRTRKVAGA